MCLTNKNTRKRAISLSCILLQIFISKFIIAQTNSKSLENLSVLDSILPPYNIGIQIQASLLPRGNIITTEGNYRLQSRLQSSYSLGLNYQVNLDYAWSMIYGLHVNLNKSNYFLHIPDSELKGFLSTSGAPQIEDKEVYFRLAIPVQLAHSLAHSKKGFYSIKGGVKLNYSGFSNDERITVRLADSNFQLKTIFYGDFTSNNNKKPWVTFLGGVSKNLYLKNRGLFSIDLYIELSRTRFIKGDYQITVPNQPATKGMYSVTGSCIGVSLQYIFPLSKKKFSLQ
jgi:hypothetical protein